MMSSTSDMMTATQLAMSGSSSSLDSISALNHAASGSHPQIAGYTNSDDYATIGQSAQHYATSLGNPSARVQPTEMRVQSFCDVNGSQGIPSGLMLGFTNEKSLRHQMTPFTSF